MGSVTILKASAGSGKTYRLVQEYIAALVDDPSSYRNILAVTFTNKATEEMKQRIVRELALLSSVDGQSPYMTFLCNKTGFSADMVRRRARAAQTNILHDYSHFSVLTIDKFFQNIIRSFLRELGISPDFNIELRTDSLLAQAADALIEQTRTDEGLAQWIDGFVAERMDSNKGWDVRMALATAGRELFGEQWDMESAAEQGAEVFRKKLGDVVARTTAQKEQVEAEMRQRAAEALAIMEVHGLTLDDFSYKASGVAGYIYKVANGVITPYGARVRDALASDEKWMGKSLSLIHKSIISQLMPLLGEICRLWDENHRLISSVEAVRKRFRSFGVLHDMALIVHRLCSEQNIIPISRTNRILQHLIEGNDAPFIFEKVGSHFTRFMIDEFQDTSRVQWENFVPLLRNALSQSGDSPVMLVGDVKQSIYRWRGGDWKILSQDVASTLGQTIEEPLTTNYRSRELVVAFNNAAIQACTSIDAAHLDSTLSKACDEGYLPAALRDQLSAMIPAAYTLHEQTSRPSNTGGYVTVTFTEPQPEPQEKDPLIGRIEELQGRGYRPCDIAVLVRRNDEARRVAALLLEHKRANTDSPYSYDVVTSEALQVGSSPVTKFIAACLTIAVDPADMLARAFWNRFRELSVHEPLADMEEQFLHSLALCPPQEAFHRVAMRYELSSYDDQTAYLQAMHEQIVRFSEQNIADTALLLQWWNETGKTEAVYMPQSESAIGIITVHAAKGLERKAIVLPYCSWPLKPQPSSTIWPDCGGTPFEAMDKIPVDFGGKTSTSYFSPEHYRELVLSHVDNINLLYVALTRACDELHICIPRRKGDKPSLLTVGDLMTAAIDVPGAKIGSMEGRVTQNEMSTVVEFGVPAVQPLTKGQAESKVRTGYPLRDPAMKVRLKLPSSRYIEDGASPEALSPRDYGILMHRVFENAASEADIRRAVEALRQDGSLSGEEAEKLGSLVSQAMQNPVISQWFGGQWELVRNEIDIIVPGQGLRRPDRVMTLGDRAIVVDYKFGLKVDASHRKQVAGYVDLMRRMGYDDAAGYIWYVSLGEVISI